MFDAIARELGHLPLIAEDLGVITPAVERLRDGLGLPGMVVLQFAFDPDDPDGPHRPENHHERQVLYTGTHDNDTLRGWCKQADIDDGLAAGVTTAESEELKRLRRENAELRRANEILKTASAFFAAAELDRHIR